MKRCFWIKWRDSEKYEHIVGLFAKIDGKYYFKYNPKLVNEDCLARRKGFKSIPYFGSVPYDKMIVSNGEIFDFLKERIPDKYDKSEWENYGLEEYDECEIISKTKAKTKTDSFFLEEIEEKKLKKVFANILGIDR